MNAQLIEAINQLGLDKKTVARILVRELLRMQYEDKTKPAEPITVNSLLKQKRLERRMTQTQLAQQSGTTQSMITAIERGKKHIPERLMHEFSKVLGVSIEELKEIQ